MTKILNLWVYIFFFSATACLEKDESIECQNNNAKRHKDKRRKNYRPAKYLNSNKEDENLDNFLKIFSKEKFPDDDSYKKYADHLIENIKRQNASFEGYESALNELKNGRKSGHWIWYIFPQIKGVKKRAGAEAENNESDLASLLETKAYLANDILRERLITCTYALLERNAIENLNKNGGKEEGAEAVMGSYTDVKKLRSSMTLFYEASKDIINDKDNVFKIVLDTYFEEIKFKNVSDKKKKSRFDLYTLEIIKSQKLAEAL